MSNCGWCGSELDDIKQHYGSPDTNELIHVACGEEFKNSRGLPKKLPVFNKTEKVSKPVAVKEISVLEGDTTND